MAQDFSHVQMLDVQTYYTIYTINNADMHKQTIENAQSAPGYRYVPSSAAHAQGCFGLSTNRSMVMRLFLIFFIATKPANPPVLW